jgi:large subunit ribosomal protein L30
MKLDALNGRLVAAVRVRGRFNIKPKIRTTLELLRLHKPNHCVVFKANSALLGMLQRAKDYITFGEISKETFVRLLMKRGERGSKRGLSKEEAEKIADAVLNGGKLKDFVDPVFRLHPPRRGWKNIKQQYPRGALGLRDNMDELLNRMM